MAKSMLCCGADEREIVRVWNYDLLSRDMSSP